jgi:hypothetical protein
MNCPSIGRRLLAAGPLAAALLALAGLTLVAVPAYGRPLAGPALAAPIPISLNKANWSGSAHYASRRPAWYQDDSGVIHLQGAVRQTSSSGAGADLIGVLPARARPAAASIYTIVHTFNGTYADLVIQPSGDIDVIGPRSPAVQDFSFLSLEGISYRRSGAGTPIGINGSNWTGPGGYNSRPPAWYRDASGVIHLQGAVSQVDSTGPGADLIGTLPPSARPHKNGFFPVHTFNGTYATLEITTSGQLLLTPPDNLVTDFSFVSLESITFRPSGPASPISVNVEQWSAGAPFDAGDPTWYADRSGLIHLQGSVRQAATIGDVSVIGTLPPRARPTADVYTIICTRAGSYADLVIQTNGDIAVIAPRFPAVTEDAFVYLQGVTFRR